jgi:hypothetical protein
MDPASGFVGIASASVTLAALALKLGQSLRDIVTVYKQSPEIIYSMIGPCQAIEVAWNRINSWVNCQFVTADTEDSAFYDQLTTSIEVG